MEMSMKKFFLLIGWLMLITIKTKAQESKNKDSIKSVTVKSVTTNNSQADYLKVVPVQYNYYNQLGAACKLELNFEKSTKVPLRLRLGSLQQTDYMEQKPNAIKPGK